jgi:hypothetical protein
LFLEQFEERILAKTNGMLKKQEQHFVECMNTVIQRHKSTEVGFINKINGLEDKVNELENKVFMNEREVMRLRIELEANR